MLSEVSQYEKYKSKKSETPGKKDICTPMFIAAQFTIAKIWKQQMSGLENYSTSTKWNTTLL